MSIIGKSRWTGKSGREYQFEDYSLDAVFDEGVKGNYIFAKPNDTLGYITPVYIGEGILKDRIEFRINEKEVLNKGCDRVCVMFNVSETYRKEVESDLLEQHPIAYVPTGCNIKQGG